MTVDDKKVVNQKGFFFNSVNQKGRTITGVDWAKVIEKVTSDTPDHTQSPLGVVTSDDARCSEVGAEILRLGGHAVDAVIATALCLGVVNPTESGIGGGSFMVVRSAFTSQARAFNMRETAPAAAFKNMYEDNPAAKVDGALSIAVPGELKGLHKAWQMYGRLPWRTLFEPAIHCAKNGFRVSHFLAHDIKEFEHKILEDPGLKEVFAPNGKILQVNETCYNPKLAETLQEIAKHGPQAFYKGAVGQRLVDDIRNKGGIMTMEDLKSYKVKISDPVEADILGYKILGVPPPSSGTVGLIMVAHVLENYRRHEALEGSLGLHRFAEAMKHMLAMKMNLGDPDYDDISEHVSLMTSKDFAKKIWAKIDDETTHPAEFYDSRCREVKDNGTGHLGVIDAERNAVALTSSLNDEFGSKMLSPSTGIVLNNQMRDFTTPADGLLQLIKQYNYMSTISPEKQSQVKDLLPLTTANLVEAGKRPLSSMTPLIILKDGHLAGVIGGSGGPNIIAAVTQVFLDHFIRGEEPHLAVHKARIYPKLLDTDLDYGKLTAINKQHIELKKVHKDFLRKRNHTLKKTKLAASCHLIVQDLKNPVDLKQNISRQNPQRFGMLSGFGDPRKNAKPAAM